MNHSTHYPSYNVLKEQDEWDPHTRRIVLSRLIGGQEIQLQLVTSDELRTLRAVCELLVDDDRPEVLDYVLYHIDRSLINPAGEGQRKPGVPPAAELIRTGLRSMDLWAANRHGCHFKNMEPEHRKLLLEQLSQGQAEPASLWNVPQQELFRKLVSLTLESYCSHPAIWSEIGYGGPAYPRGYIRESVKEPDPWEAKKE